jgi:predicted nucleic acid-binding protein
MTTAIDTNVIVALWYKDDALNSLARSAMDSALARDSLVISAPVFTELLAFPARTEPFIEYFLEQTGIAVEWDLDESVWRTAGRAFQRYAARRRRHGDPGPRRILADFLIGAHALQRGYRLLTLDDRFYRSAFRHLTLVAV